MSRASEFEKESSCRQQAAGKGRATNILRRNEDTCRLRRREVRISSDIERPTIRGCRDIVPNRCDLPIPGACLFAYWTIFFRSFFFLFLRILIRPRWETRTRDIRSRNHYQLCIGRDFVFGDFLLVPRALQYRVGRTRLSGKSPSEKHYVIRIKPVERHDAIIHTTLPRHARNKRVTVRNFFFWPSHVGYVIFCFEKT